MEEPKMKEKEGFDTMEDFEDWLSQTYVELSEGDIEKIVEEVKLMDKELKRDLVGAWRDNYEVLADLEDLDDDEIIKCRRDIEHKVRNGLELLGDHITEEDLENY